MVIISAVTAIALGACQPVEETRVGTSLPVMADDRDLTIGIYYNIMCPIERENRCQPQLMEYFTKYLDGKTPDFLTLDQFETLNSYALTKVPSGILLERRLAPLTLQALKEGMNVAEAFAQSLNKIQTENIPQYKQALEQLKNLQEGADRAATRARYATLIKAVKACIKHPDELFENRLSLLQTEHEKKGLQPALTLLEQWAKKVPSQLSAEEQKLEHFENRRAVMVQQIKELREKVPHGAAFLALQEATPETVPELREDLKELFPTWISYNNATGKETQVVEKEELFGESTSFTSTIALTPEFKVIRTEIGELPSSTGIHPRKILGVEVENANTKRRLALFTTHTDTDPKAYHDTVVKVHEFVSKFIAATPDISVVFGGDLNAFNGPLGTQFIKEMREGPFAGGKDYREGKYFYSHKSIQDATFLGFAYGGFEAKFINGRVEPNALDHILTKNVDVIAGARCAVVYDEKGKLVDPDTQPDLYQERLELRRTASDHFLNAVIFRR